MLYLVLTSWKINRIFVLNCAERSLRCFSDQIANTSACRIVSRVIIFTRTGQWYEACFELHMFTLRVVSSHMPNSIDVFKLLCPIENGKSWMIYAWNIYPFIIHMNGWTETWLWYLALCFFSKVFGKFFVRVITNLFNVVCQTVNQSSWGI